MKRMYIKWRRNRSRDAVLTLGPRIRQLEAARMGVDGALWPETAHELDLEIASTRRLLNKRLDYLRNTEAL